MVALIRRRSRWIFQVPCGRLVLPNRQRVRSERQAYEPPYPQIVGLTGIEWDTFRTPRLVRRIRTRLYRLKLRLRAFVARLLGRR